jgi:exodeoxyribonuclease V beta subunit
VAKHHLSQVGSGSSFGARALGESPAEDEVETPLDREDPLRGPVFGEMVHRVLEEIDFAEVKRAACPDDLTQPGSHARRLIDMKMSAGIPLLKTRTPIDLLDKACRQQIAGLVWHALRTPLSELGGPLCEIEQSNRLAEIEFTFPEHPGAAVPADQCAEDGFVTGFMDLLIRKGDKYFLVDWKTNLLPGYDYDQLERSMTDADYHRQYRLYVHAIRRWLHRITGSEFSYGTHFGGVYYLYVRGLNGRDESAGVYFHRPSEAELNLAPLMQSR